MEGILGQEAGHDPDLRRGRHRGAGDGGRRPGPASWCSARPRTIDGYEAVQLGLVEDQGRRKHVDQAGAGPLQEGRRRRRCAGSPSSALAEGEDAQGRRPGQGLDLRGDRVRRRGRHQQGQGLPGRHQAPRLPRRPRHATARCSIAPRARSARSSYPSRVFPGMRGRRPDGRRAGDGEEPAVVKVDEEQNLLYLRGAVPGAARRLRRPSAGRRRASAMKIAVKNLANKTVREIELPDEVFGYPYKEHLIHIAVQVDPGRRSARGTHKTKTRSEVSGSGKKLWRQKGTGRARIGSIRSPLWRHGGTVHGPQPRDYAKDLSRGEKKNALKSALSRKLARGAARGAREPRAAEPQDRATLRERLAGSGHRRQGAAGRPPRQPRTSSWRRATTRRSRPSTRSASTSTTWSTGPTWWSASGARAAGGGARRDENPGRHPPPADHREVDRAARGANVIAFEVRPRANKIQIKQRGRGAVQGQGRRGARGALHGKVRRQGRFAGHRPDWKKAYVRLARTRSRSSSSRAM